MADSPSAGSADAYLEEVEFLARYRFPRPISTRVERVITETSTRGRQRAVRACARATLRLLAAVHQAQRRARGEVAYVVVPQTRALREGFPADYFIHELAEQREPVARLLALAGELGGGLPLVADEDLSRETLLDTLAAVRCLARYRLLIPGPWDRPYYKGAVVLMGAGLTFYGQAIEGPEIPRAEPLLCDPHTGRLLGLSPQLCWQEGPTPAQGTLFVLRATDRADGIYDEVGAAAARRLKLPLTGVPRRIEMPLLPGQVLAVQHPPGRYQDGDRFAPHYEIHGVMWRGGVADIYRAVRSEDGAPVVLKTFEGEEDGENRSRFTDEMDFAGRVEHANVITYRRARHLSSHLVMELDYVAGGNLAERLAVAGVMDPFGTLAILEPLCQALEAIHGAGIIHLDLKPENLLFTANGDLRLIDFGISVTRDRLHRFIRPGSLVGTPGFIPPERRAGNPVDPRADLWELGVLASEMLLGERLQGPDEVPHPPELSRVLGDVLRRLLEPDPDARYGSAAEVAEAFRSAVSQVKPLRCIALDLEGTLLTTAFDPLPRPYLKEFAQWCLDTFDRIFIYTAVDERTARVIIARFVRAGILPARFAADAKLVTWSRGIGGSLKDLRLLGLPLHWVVLLDDMREWVVTNQQHRWVRIAAFDEPRPGDAELRFIRSEILARFETDS